MPNRLLKGAVSLFDLLEQRWDKLTTQRRVASVLVIVFVAGLALVEARRIPWLPLEFIERLPSNHFEAILLPFTLLLLAEVISLVFAIAQSVAIAVGKQLEIMSLILIRLALTAPREIDAGLGVIATVFAIALTWVYNRTTAVEIESPISAF